MKRPFIYPNDGKFLCPYCKGKLKIQFITINEMEYNENGNLEIDLDHIIETEKIVCTKCGIDVTDFTEFDISTFSRKRKDNINKVKKYKIDNPFYGESGEYYGI